MKRFKHKALGAPPRDGGGEGSDAPEDGAPGRRVRPHLLGGTGALTDVTHALAPPERPSENEAGPLRTTNRDVDFIHRPAAWPPPPPDDEFAQRFARDYRLATRSSCRVFSRSPTSSLTPPSTTSRGPTDVAARRSCAGE